MSLIAAPTPAFSWDAVSYHLSYNLAEPAVVAVRIDLPNRQNGEQFFVMPRAIPMGYAVVPYGRFVEGVQAFPESGVPATVKRATGRRWRVGV